MHSVQRRVLGNTDGGFMSMMRQRGFSMIEVLVTLLVVMFGLLGLAGMQLMAVNNTEVARYKNIATIMASSMAAKMQTNTGYWGTPPTTISVTGSTLTGGPTGSAGTTCVGTPCTQASDVAFADLISWGNAMATGLPSGSGTISCTLNPSPAVCTVTVTWLEKNIAIVNPTGAASGPLAAGKSSTNSFQTLVSIPQ